MSTRPKPREIETWFPSKWSHIAGNQELKEQWQNMLQTGPHNMVVTGPNGSAKSRTCLHGLRSIVCKNRNDELNPCERCEACKLSKGRMTTISGLFAEFSDAAYSVHVIDCQTVTAGELKDLCSDSSIDDPGTIVFFDEIGELVRRDLFREIKSACDECKSSWIGTSVSLKPIRVPGRRQPIVQWPPEMNRRFGSRQGTTLPNANNLRSWIWERCHDWEIELENDQVTLDMVQRSKLRVRHVLEMLVLGASKPNRTLTRDDIRRFNLVCPD